MESPLSFDSTENFRKKLLLRNLKPYKIDGIYSSNEPVKPKEYQIVDYSVIDSESIDNIGNKQEKILYSKNKYGPIENDSTYGDTVQINLNLNTETNFGNYTYEQTIKSKLENIGNSQEKLLYVQNLYGPVGFNTSYGETVDINQNLQVNTNLGPYGYQRTVRSKLETIGNQKEIDLIVKNTYKPSSTALGFGDTVWFINDDLVVNTNGSGEYDINDTVESNLETIGNQREIFSKIKNVYKPDADDFGEPVYFINNDLVILTTGNGLYSIDDTFSNYLEQIGNQREVVLRTKNKYNPENTDGFGDTKYSINNDLQGVLGSNVGEYDFSDTIGNQLEQNSNIVRNELFPFNQYGPENGQSLFIVPINNNLQTNPPEGNYGPGIDDAIGSLLEVIGDAQEVILVTKNKYNPENVDGFGSVVTINDDLQGALGSNFGEYDFSDTIGNQLEQNSTIVRNELFPLSQYGPENGQSENTVTPNINQNTNSNEGNYDFSDSIGSPLEVFGVQNLNFQINQYGPEGPIGNASDDNVNLQTKPFEGEYDFTDTINNELQIIGQQEANDAYIINRYVTGDGDYDPITIDDIIFDTTGQRYYNSAQSFVFQPSEYLPLNLFISDNPNGSNGTLSQDSSLAQISAKQLQKEFKYRVAAELLSETLGRVNVLNSSIDPDSGEISVKPRLDPFNGLGILTGNVPLLQRNYKITSPDLITGKAISFVGKLTGLYSPYSIIPDEYFDYPEKRLLNELIENPIGVLTNTVMGAVRSIISPKIRKGSDLFLAYTSPATRDLLWGQLFYNEYRPDYRLNSVRNPNLFSPKPNFYIGTRKNTITEIVSPTNALPEFKKGVPFDIAVYGYGEIGKEYEGKKITDIFFGINTRPLYDGTTSITSKFSWTTRRSFFEPGKKVGLEGKKFRKSTVFDAELKKDFKDSESFRNNFTEGSILDITQKIVDSGSRNGVRQLEHVGNAINQVSKVFNDGYIELTKGSRVIKYKTKNSVEKTNKPFEGFEYCRIFTKDNPYYTFSQLQKIDGMTTSGRKSTYSIFDKTYNLNIAPLNNKNGQSTNIINSKVKKYMFSLENLAWRTSNKPGFTYDDLPACERGPNGGRIMWFPPYDLTFDDNSTANWHDTVFIGRPEPIYTYKNTSRTGTLNWSIIVDHPSITEVLINKELENVTPDSQITKILDSFFAGCLKYDLYTLAEKYVEFSPNEIQEAINVAKSTEDVERVLEELPPSEPEINEEIQTTISELEVQEVFMFFDNDEPTSSDENDYEYWYNEYIGNTNYENGTNVIDEILLYPKFRNTTTTNTIPNNTENIDYDKYIDARKDSVKDFFQNNIKNSLSNLKDFLSKIGKILDSGGEVNFELFGTASGVNNPNYNSPLSERRNKSVEKYILNYEYNGKKLEKYKTENKLKITLKAGGSETSIKDPTLKDIDCKKKFRDAGLDNQTRGRNDKEGVYSVQAMACRRTKIQKLSIKPAPVEPDEDENETNNNSTQTGNQQNVTPQNVAGSPATNIQNTQIYAGLAKKLIRNLLSECDYFQMINDQDPMVYDGFKNKFKYFHPLFHSITPEGLNSRLTFLNQCVRPGDTIPTVQETGAGTFTLNYDDAFNSAFGSPPILVLRIGDFFHTKITPKSLTIKFSDKAPLFDINPEGIGVQPMSAAITLSFNFIGGQGIAGPVSTLQNALSFNYYANTELYDERAEITDESLNEYDAEFYEDAKKNTKTNKQNKIETELGDPIGIRKETNIDGSGNTSGTISYEKIMGSDLINYVKDYTNTVYLSLKEISDKYSIGGLYIINTDRNYQDGFFRNIDSPGSYPTPIYGKSNKFQNKINLLFSKIKDDIDLGIIPVLAGSEQPSNNFTNSEIRKVKRQLKSMVDKKKGDYLRIIDEKNNNIVSKELELIKIIDKLNYVSNARDGFETKTSRSIIYNLAGKTPVDVSNTSYANTLEELKGDFKIVSDNLVEYNNKLKENKIITTTDDQKWNDSFDFELFIGNNQSSQENRFNMVFSDNIVTNVQSFIDEIVTRLNNNDKQKWKEFIADNLGCTVNGQSTSVLGIFNQYKNQKTIVDDRFSNFLQYYDQNFKIYNPFNKTKTRILDFTTQIPVNGTDSNNLKDLGRNVPGQTYNLKKRFN